METYEDYKQFAAYLEKYSENMHNFTITSIKFTKNKEIILKIKEKKSNPRTFSAEITPNIVIITMDDGSLLTSRFIIPINIIESRRDQSNFLDMIMSLVILARDKTLEGGEI
jgi:hypothetical protein